MAGDKEKGVLRSMDWWTICIYVALLTFGWISVCGASYTFGETDVLSLDTRSGMQVVWIGTSLCIGLVLLLLDDRYYDTFAYVIYGLLLLLLFATIFNPHEIKGSRSWLVLGPLRLQPAEFAKFATGCGKVYEHLWLQYPPCEGFCRYAGSHTHSHAVYCDAEGNGLGIGIYSLLFGALS